MNPQREDIHPVQDTCPYFILYCLTCNSANLHFRGAVPSGINKMPILFIL